MSKIAVLALEDGSIFRGMAIGSDGEAGGEVVFNTAMTGYQEILTDPSYSRQIVTLTYPHIGNTGITPLDAESNRIHAAALVIKDLPIMASNFRSKQSLDEYLKSQNIVAIAGIDTRRLTRILREKGAQNGYIVTGAVTVDATGSATNNEADEDLTENRLIEQALMKVKTLSGLKGVDLAKEVTTSASYEWTEGEWSLEKDDYNTPTDHSFHVVAYDFGVKRTILRMLSQRGCRLTVVPADTSAKEVLALNPDGVFLSNGPGDPEPCDYAIQAIQDILETELPLFGICLGHQLLALASGAKTEKMKFGHHGANHPVQDVAQGNVMITSQNHGFSVSYDALPDHLNITHKSLFDGSLQGLERTDRPAFSFQGHPEASPGPHDVAVLFDRFIEMLSQSCRQKNPG